MNKIIFLALFLALVASCNLGSSSFEIGDDLTQPESKVLLVDTFSVKLSTIQIDSLRASGSDISNCIIGKYSDEISGDVEFVHYSTFDYTAISQDAIFDSVTIKLYYSKYSLGDTLKSFELSVYQLDKRLEIFDKPNISNDYNYNTTKFTYSDENLIAKHRFSPKPSSDSIEFKINHSFGKEIFDWIVNDKTLSDKNTRFAKFLKGFAFQKTNDGNVIIGFNNKTGKKMQMTIYTHEKGVNYKTTKTVLNLDTYNSNFSGITKNREGSTFANLIKQKNAINSSTTDNLAMIQGGAGAVVKVEFPSINSIYLMANSSFLRAQLMLFPDLYVNDRKNLPKELNFYITDYTNTFYTNSILTNSSSENITATLYEDIMNDTYYYGVDITSFMTEQLSGSSYNTDRALVVAFSPINMYTSADILYLNNVAKKGNIKTKLNLYLLQYE